jgi:hypothetical protein
MCDPGTMAIVATAASVAGTITSSVASYTQHRYEAKLAEANQQQENNRARDALDRGEITARDTARRQSALAGAQRAAMAANGVDLSFGSASDLLGDTAMLGMEEQTTVRENTRREVQGFDINAANFGAQAKAAKSAATGALISGALQTVSTIAGGAQRYGKIKADQSAGLSGWGG